MDKYIKILLIFIINYFYLKLNWYKSDYVKPKRSWSFIDLLKCIYGCIYVNLLWNKYV